MRKNAIGLIETRGLVAAVEALDTCLKAAQVDFVSHWYPTGGLVCVIVSGEVGAVKAAIDAGKVAADKIGEVVGAHVIPRPVDDIWNIAKPIRGHVIDHNKVSEVKIECDGGQNDVLEENDDDSKEISEDILEAGTSQLINMFQDTKAKSLVEEGKRLDQYGVRKLRRILRSLPAEDIDKSRISNMRKKELLAIITDCILKGERD